MIYIIDKRKSASLSVFFAALAAALFLLLEFAPPKTAHADTPFLIFDNFTDTNGTRLSEHIPNKAPLGGGWQEITGAWFTIQNKATETSGPPTDARAVIDAEESDIIASARLTWNDGFSGLVVRYSDENNWIMAWFDGSQDIVLGKKVGGVFNEAARAPVDWGREGMPRHLEVIARGPVLRVTIGDTPLINAVIDDLIDNTLVGLFSRNGDSNRFSDFRVKSAAWYIHCQNGPPTPSHRFLLVRKSRRPPFRW